jgi:hypothetical protein
VDHKNKRAYTYWGYWAYLSYTALEWTRYWGVHCSEKDQFKSSEKHKRKNKNNVGLVVYVFTTWSVHEI